MGIRLLKSFGAAIGLLLCIALGVAATYGLIWWIGHMSMQDFLIIGAAAFIAAATAAFYIIFEEEAPGKPHV